MSPRNDVLGGGSQQPAFERWRHFADTVGDAFCVLDPQLRCTGWNSVCERLRGIAAQDAVGRPLRELLPEAEDACRSALSTGEPRRDVVEVAALGGRRSLELTICPADEGVCVLGRDVTDQLNARQTLRASEARYRMLLEDVPAITYAAALDDNATPIYVSPQAERLLGHPASRYESEPSLWLNQVHPEDRDRILAEAQEARKEGRGRVTEYRVVRPDGRTVWFRDEAALVRSADGRPLYWQGVAFDITDGKEAEEALRESEERYRSLVELSPDPILVLVEDRIAFANQAAAETLGFQGPQETLGQSGVDMVHPDFRDVVAERVRRAAMEDFANAPIELKVRRRDGVERVVESVSLPVTFHGRAAVQVVFRDVTEHRATDDRLHEYREALRALASRISMIEEQERRRIADSLHDHIAQTLALSRIKLGLLLEVSPDAGTATQLEEVRQMIQECISYTRTLIFELSPPILYEMGLEAALSRLAENVEGQYGIQTSFEDDGRPKPLGEEERALLFQATRELLVNAGRHAGPCRVKVFTGVEDGWIVVRVEDDGAGFEAAGEALRVHEDGGFGLFNVRERLDKAGGRLELRSQPGRGTVATLLVPLKGGPDPQPGAEQ